MMNRVKQLTTALSLSISIALSLAASQSVTAYEDLRRLLLEKPLIKDETLTTLFSIGDARIQGLIRALDDPNTVVRRNAQIVIRYLGNDEGMKVLIDGYKKSRVYVLAGPIPLPLRDWDYEYIRKQYLSQSGEWDQSTASYMYALALDGSPEAVALLSELNAQIEKGAISYHYALQQVKSIKSNWLGKEPDLVKLVVDNAFFISSDHLEHASGKLLGFNYAKDKALIEVNVGGVPLAEERYHVVLQSHREGWRVFSVRRVAVS